MKAVVNEPKAKYRASGWQTKSQESSFDDHICGIENETVIFCQLSGFKFMFFSDKPKNRLSALKGKLTKQSNKEIDDQISELRSEWDRNI
jgi:hypothetical protein